MDYKKSYQILEVCISGGAIIVFIGCSLSMKFELFGSILAGVGLIGMIFGLIQAFVFYKCPKCGKRFNIRSHQPNYCPACGCKLEQ